MRSTSVAVILAALCVLGCDAEVESTAVAAAAVDPTGIYPSDITPPAGTEYPCALTALPRELEGVPKRDRDYINRTYARILRATQAKLVLLKALSEQRDLSGALDAYLESTSTLLDALRAEQPPEGLDAFHSDVVRAIRLQRQFFQKAADARGAGESMETVYEIPEGRQASSRLFAAWAKMKERYPEWDEATKDSIYHHLCALDLF